MKPTLEPSCPDGVGNTPARCGIKEGKQRLFGRFRPNPLKQPYVVSETVLRRADVIEAVQRTEVMTVPEGFKTLFRPDAREAEHRQHDGRHRKEGSQFSTGHGESESADEVIAGGLFPHAVIGKAD